MSRLEDLSGDLQFFTKPLSIPFFSLHRFDKIMKENVHLVCNNNVDSLKGRKETVKTLYIQARACWKPLFVWSASGKTHYRKRSHQSGKKMLFYLILPPKAVGTSCSPSQHFQGPLSKYNFAEGGVQRSLCFRVVKPANSDLCRICEVAPLAGNWIHIGHSRVQQTCWNVAYLWC